MTIDDAFDQAVGLHRAGRIADAAQIFRHVVDRQPGHSSAMHHLAICLSQLGDFESSIPYYEAVLTANPTHAGCLNNLGNALQALQRFDAALNCYERAIALNPGNATLHCNRGNCLKQLGRHGEALASYERALGLSSSNATAYFNRGALLHSQRRFDEALADFDAAISLDPRGATLYGARGVTLYELRRYDAALADVDRAIAINPRDEQAFINRASVLQKLRRPDDALFSCDRAIALNPDLGEAHCNRGGILKEMLRYDAALASLDRAIALKPDLAEAHCNRGAILKEMLRYDAALASLDRAIALKPDLAEAHANRAAVFRQLLLYDNELMSIERALALNPDMDYAVGDWLACKMNCCAWSGLDAAFDKVLAGIDRGERTARPFIALSLPSTPEQQQRCARTYTAREHPTAATPLPPDEPQSFDRIRVGYLSAAFRNHPGAHLMAHLLECHDRSKFEIIGLYVGPPANDVWRRRLERAFDSFYDLGSRSDLEIAALVRGLGIDILVHRDGHTEFARTGVFALRPAPLQINYLGYPGTMGAPYIDYMIADRTLIPEESRRYYDEKIIYLPHSYQPNDVTRPIPDKVTTRGAHGLPEDAFVFCSFNNNYKITPDVFDVWMQLLRRVEHAVLWLLEGNATAARNLRQEAESRGVSPERLVFAPRIEIGEHLARHRCADLFLDTFYYNAHTTASDALWAGLPVLTCQGEAFAARVAASLLAAIGLPELIARRRDEYEAMALDLATDPRRLTAIRRKLAHNRTTHPLFDTVRYARDLERAYLRMHERRRAGLAPDHIVIDA